MAGDLKDQAKGNLVQLASVDFFEGTSTDIFRSELIQSLESVLTACCQVQRDILPPSTSLPTTSCITRYDGEALRECLSEIDWTGLSSHYDKAQGRKDAAVEDTPSSSLPITPLEEVLTALENPLVWPVACTRPILEVLIQTLWMQRTLQNSTSSRSHWPLSHQCILEALAMFCRRIPAARRLPASVLTVHVHQVTSVHELNALLSLTKYFCKEFPSDNLLYIQCVLEILCRLDNMATFCLDDTAPRPSADKKRRTKLNTCASVELLHGELTESEEARFSMSVARQYPGPRGLSMPRMKCILMTKIDDGAISLLAKPAEVRRLRTKCIKFLVMSRQRSNQSGSALLGRVLDTLAPRLLGAASVRLSLILLADQSNADASGFTTLLHFYWSQASEIGSRMHLVSYAELIVECSCFDSYDECCNAVEPLLDELRRCCMHETDTAVTLARPYLRCFAYILSRRGKILSQQSEFAAFLAQLSAAFDEPSDWIGPGMSGDERARILQTLQLSGVLGVCDGMDVDVDADDDTNDDESTDTMTFPPLHAARMAARQIPLVPRLLFSTISPLNGLPPPSVSAENASLNAPIMEFVNQDVLHHVFSFLGYKRIVRLRHVCTEWKRVADSRQLWRGVYQSRYDLRADDAIAQNEAAPWKTLFKNKWLAERELAFRRNKNGWKFRLCGYVRCMHVVKSKAQLRKHHATHTDKSKKRKQSPKKKLDDDSRKKTPKNMQTK